MAYLNPHPFFETLLLVPLDPADPYLGVEKNGLLGYVVLIHLIQSRVELVVSCWCYLVSHPPYVSCCLPNLK